MEFVIISGLSGGGKSKAAATLEDIGYYCVDNLPASLIPDFAGLCMASAGRYSRVALVSDIRGGQTFDTLFDSLDKLREMHCDYRLLFMEASEEVLIKRFKESRRMPPLSRDGRSLVDALREEHLAMAPVRRRADFIIDTSALSLAKLRGELLRLFGGTTPRDAMEISVLSFGYKYGIPLEADLVFDVRFLANPYYIETLRSQTGLDQGVYDFLFSYQQTRDFMTQLENLLTFLFPLYVDEGKTSLVIAVGCTGGHHRSVAIAHALVDFIRQKGYHVSEGHRDMIRG